MADIPVPGPLEGEFTAIGESDALIVRGQFNVSIFGTFVGTLTLRRQFAGKTDWRVVGTYTAPIELASSNCERNVRYSFECTAYTSGTIGYRISY